MLAMTKRPRMNRLLACVGALAVAASACGGDYGSPSDFLTALSAELALTYLDPAGAQHSATIPLARDGATLDERGQWFAQESTARATALALITQAMHDACDAYATSHEEALAILRPALARFEADAEALAADDLLVEVDLAQDLLRLFELGAPQGTLYGN